MKKTISKKQVIAEAKAIYNDDCLENGWTLKEWIEDYIKAMEEDGYIVI